MRRGEERRGNREGKRKEKEESKGKEKTGGERKIRKRKDKSTGRSRVGGNEESADQICLTFLTDFPL